MQPVVEGRERGLRILVDGEKIRIEAAPIRLRLRAIGDAHAAGDRLLGRREPALRESALAWLAERADDPSDVAILLARVAGDGAAPSQAADLLQLLRDALSQRFTGAPYYLGRREDADRVLLDRTRALAEGAAATEDRRVVSAMFHRAS